MPCRLCIHLPAAICYGMHMPDSPSARFICRMPNDLFARLRVAASERSVPMARIVFAGVERELSAPPHGLDRSIEVEALEGRILELETEAAWFASKEVGWEAQSRAASDVIAKQAEEIATLKKALVPGDASKMAVKSFVASLTRAAPNFKPSQKAALAKIGEEPTDA